MLSLLFCHLYVNVLHCLSCKCHAIGLCTVGLGILNDMRDEDDGDYPMFPFTLHGICIGTEVILILFISTHEGA